MIAQSFEIKVAFIGYVSVGKTTVLNALLRDKYSEVSMRRTTAGVNYFRISASTSIGKPQSSDESDNSESKSMDWSMVTDNVRTAKSTWKEIRTDNAMLRESDKVEEKVFDIELEENVCEMRKDTRLVFVDIPGINEAGASSKYKNYVAKKWHTFDCAIVIMDAKQGVNTQDQVELLNFVKANLRSKKDIPVIILGNKFDEPDDEEQEMLVSEVRSEVEEIFEVGSREAALDKLIQDTEAKAKFTSAGEVFPVFIPTSAIHAFIYQTASLLEFECFKTFDQDLIERLGREQIGKKKWRQLSKGDKYQAVFDVIADPMQYKEGLEETNFNKFIAILTHCIGGRTRQTELLNKQIDVEISLISYETCIATQLQSIYHKCKALGRDVGFLKTAFRIVYRQCKDDALVKFKKDAKAVDCLVDPMEQLISYSEFVGKAEWDDEKEAVAKWAKALVQRQFEVIFKAHSSWVSDKEKSPWKELLGGDWIWIIESLLLLSYNRHFCELFGKEKIFLEGLRQRVYDKFERTDYCPSCCRRLSTDTRHCSSCGKRFRFTNPEDRMMCPNCKSQGLNLQLDSTGRCKHYCNFQYEQYPNSSVNLTLQYNYTNGKFIPINADKLKDLFHIEVPDSLSDPKHFGHVAWKFSQFMASLENN